MLTDTEFISQSITINLFYLINIRSFSLNLKLALKDKEQKDIAHKYFLETKKIINSFINIVDGLIPYFAIRSNFVVTNYTLECTTLTEKLFNIDLDTEITEKLLSLSYVLPKIPTEKDINLMTEVNNKTYDLSISFTKFLKEVFIKEGNNELFSYTSPYFIRSLIDLIEVHTIILKRTINKTAANPTSVVNYEYLVICFFQSCVTLICSFVDPSRNDIYDESNSFRKEFKSLKEKYKTMDSTPDEIHKTTVIAKKVIIRFSKFLKYIITDLVNEKVYFIVEPLILDDMLRITNYVIYNINILEVRDRKIRSDNVEPNYYKYGTKYIVEPNDNLYEIALRFNTTVDMLKELNNLTSDVLHPGQMIVVDNLYNPKNEDIYKKYVVKEKDTIYSIAFNFGMTPNELLEINNLIDEEIFVGDTIYVYNNMPQFGDKESYIVKRGDSLYTIAKKFNTTVKSIKELNNLQDDNLVIGMKLIVISEQLEPTEENEVHIILPGDNVYKISENFGITPQELMELNNLTDDKLTIGDQLLVPKVKPNEKHN